MTALSSSWERLAEALIHVEDVEHDDCGVLSFGSDSTPSGIFVERGRICWVAAPGMQRRLRDLLATGRAGPEFDKVYERCRREGRVLGETLVDEGWITAGELEQAVRRHSAESLVALSHLDTFSDPSWSSRGSRSYAPRFTFRPIDLLLDIVALDLPEHHDVAMQEIARVEGANRCGAAFLVDDTLRTAVPLVVFGGLSIRALWSLGSWAVSLPLATRELGATPLFTLATTLENDTIAVWWRGPILYAVACDDRAAAASLIALHLFRGDP